VGIVVKKKIVLFAVTRFSIKRTRTFQGGKLSIVSHLQRQEPRLLLSFRDRVQYSQEALDSFCRTSEDLLLARNAGSPQSA
jgi:hypothetical protein